MAIIIAMICLMPGIRSVVTPILTKWPRKSRMRSGVMVIFNNNRNGFAICRLLSCVRKVLKFCLIALTNREIRSFFRDSVSIISKDSLVFCRLNTTADKPVMMGLTTPIMKAGIFPIQANRGRVSLATVHQVPAVQMVNISARKTKTTAVVAINTLRTVKPVLKSSLILTNHLDNVSFVIMSVTAL